jgi:hypothetical protein
MGLWLVFTGVWLSVVTADVGPAADEKTLMDCDPGGRWDSGGGDRGATQASVLFIW